MSRLFRALLLLLLLPLATCDSHRLSAQQDADLRGLYEKMRVNDLAGLEAAFDPKVQRPQLHQGLSFMQGMIPPQAPASRVLKAVVTPDGKGGTEYGALYEFDYPSTAVLAQLGMRQDATGHKSVLMVVLRQEPVGISKGYDFTLSGRKPYQFAFLFLVALAPGLGVWALVRLWRAPDIKWKFLWALALCIGFMDLKMDWKSGDVVLNLYFLHPLWVSASKFGPLSPWMISTSLPVAAIAFLLGYRRLDRPWDPPKA